MLTYKTKLEFPSEKVRTFWTRQMCLVRDCYNFASKIAYEEKLPLGMMPFHKRLYRAEREAFPTLPAQMCIKVNRQVLANYRTAKENNVELEKPLEMKRSAIGLDRRLYSRMTRESFCLSNGDGNRRSEVKFVLYPKFNEMAEKYRMCDPVLQYDKINDTFYACIPFLTLDTTPHPDSYLGVDLGMKRIATLSDGTAITDKTYLAKRRRIRHNKRTFQRHKAHSHSARRKLKRLRRKEYNYSKEFCHKVANEILSHNGSVIVMVEYYIPCTDEHSFACGLRGQYRTETGVVWKVDMEVGKTITVNQKMIAFDDILAITAKKDNIFACTWDES